MTRRLLFFICLLGLAWPLHRAEAQSDHGFRFVRIQYGVGGLDGMGRFGGAPWSHDHPTAELNFYEALERTTAIRTVKQPVVLSLSDEAIFEHPVLYLCEPGYWTADDDEIDQLRAYLERGGFILFDDMRGEAEWDNLVYQMARVFPDRAFTDVPPDHAIWNIYYDVDPVEAPSNVRGGRFGGGFSKFDDRYLALFDDNKRMVALVCYNQDIGDGWEWPELNFEDASTISFQMGINFLVYALTH